jgi:hypothetical protein
LQDTVGPFSLAAVAEDPDLVKLGAVGALDAKYNGQGASLIHSVAFFDQDSDALGLATALSKAFAEKGYKLQGPAPVKVQGKVVGQFFLLQGADDEFVIWSNTSLFALVHGPSGGPTTFFKSARY